MDNKYNDKQEKNKMLQAGMKAPGIFPAGPKRNHPHVGRIQGEKGGPVFLPEGQYAGMHQAGMRFWGTLPPVSGKGGGSNRGQQRQHSFPQKI